MLKILAHLEEGPGPDGQPTMRWTATAVDYAVSHATYDPDHASAVHGLIAWIEGQRRAKRKALGEVVEGDAAEFAFWLGLPKHETTDIAERWALASPSPVDPGRASFPVDVRVEG